MDAQALGRRFRAQFRREALASESIIVSTTCVASLLR